MQAEQQVADVAHVIQLAVAPVFLLTGVGALLGVLTNRLARIVDRARQLQERTTGLSAAERSVLYDDLKLLSRRARLVNRAIGLCTLCELLICGVIGAIFLAAFFQLDLKVIVAASFIVAMLLLIGGLLYFLREVQLSTRSLRIGPP